MLKIVKKDYPWTVIIEDKISKNTGKKYQSIGIGFTEKNAQATCDAEKYKTTWLNLFNEDDLLKGASTFENVYQRLKFERDKEKEKEKDRAANKPETPKAPAPQGWENAPEELDDDISF